jgi:hypothetical protein
MTARFKALIVAALSVSALFGAVGLAKASGPLLYRGGEVQNNPHVYLTFWGSNWNQHSGARTEIRKMFEGLSGSGWQGILTQYFDHTGPISSNVGLNSWTDQSIGAPSNVNDQNLVSEIEYSTLQQGWPAYSMDNLYVVLPAPGSKYQSGFLEACAVHRFSGTLGAPYFFVGWPGDPEFAACNEANVEDWIELSVAASHEYAEAVTDPVTKKFAGVPTGWIDADEEEIADKCKFQSGQLGNGSWVEPLWDNSKNTCSMSNPSPPQFYAVSTPSTKVSSTRATLNGYVNPGAHATNYHFEWGTTTSYGSNTPVPDGSVGSGTSNVNVSQVITGLNELTTYHYRLVATNSQGYQVWGQDQVFSTPVRNNTELGFVGFNGTANTTFDGYVGYPGNPYYQGHAVWGETGYPKITDPQNIDALAIDGDGNGLDELGFVRFNGTGNTHIDTYTGPNYKTLSGTCDTGYPKITDPQNIQTVGIDSNGDGVDELGFIRFNGTGNTHLDGYTGSCFKTLSSQCDTGYPKITDPQNVQAVALDTDGDGADELAYVRFNGTGNTHVDVYGGGCFKTLMSSCDTGYPKITDPQNVRAMAIDVDGNGTDELGFLRYNAASGKAHLDTYSGSCYKTLFSSGDTGYPATSKPENVEAVGINWTTDPAPGAWYTDNVGGSVNSDPDLASWEYNRLDLFARGAADNGLMHRAWIGSWFPWEKIGSEVLSSGPSAVSWGNGRLDMVARSSTGIRHWWLQSPGSWNLAENFTGNFTSDPDISSWGPNRLDIFVRGSDNRLWHKAWSNGWFEWEQIGTATLASGPGAVSWGSGRIDIVARASDSTVMHWWFDNSTGVWSGPENLGGNITSDPDISSWGPGRLDVFGKGADGTLQHKYYANGAWSGWESLGGSPASGPGAVSWAGNRVDVVARTAANTVEHWFWMDP